MRKKGSKNSDGGTCTGDGDGDDDDDGGSERGRMGKAAKPE